MEDFFKELEECLQGEVPEKEIRDSLLYYRQYFSEQAAAGYSESEILQSLGSPRLIARSIIDAREAMEEREGYEEKGARQSSYYNTEQDDYNNDEEENPIQIKKLEGLKLVLVILLILIILGLLIRVFLPVVIILIPVILILRLLWGNRWR